MGSFQTMNDVVFNHIFKLTSMFCPSSSNRRRKLEATRKASQNQVLSSLASCPLEMSRSSKPRHTTTPTRTDRKTNKQSFALEEMKKRRKKRRRKENKENKEEEETKNGARRFFSCGERCEKNTTMSSQLNSTRSFHFYLSRQQAHNSYSI